MGWLGSEVAHHPSVDDVAEVSLEDAHGFLLGVAAAAGIVVDLSCAWFAAQLCNCDSVQAGVDASVAAAVEAMPDGCAVSFGAGGGEWALPLKRAKPPVPVNRRGSPTSTRSSASIRSAMPHSSLRVEPACRASFSSALAASRSWASSCATASR